MRITFSVPLMTKYPPGSIGHSLSFAISAGVLFVRTQFELRNMIGILKTHREEITIKFADFETYH